VANAWHLEADVPIHILQRNDKLGQFRLLLVSRLFSNSLTTRAQQQVDLVSRKILEILKNMTKKFKLARPKSWDFRP